MGKNSGGVNAAILRYVGAPNTEPTTAQTPSVMPLQETNLHPLVNPAAHPIHLHGHTFSVVRSAGSTQYNYDSPVRRDVVNVGGNDPVNTDNVTIRFETDNSGPWFLHCHIDWHLSAGFGVVMAEDVPDVKSTEKNIPAAWDQLCPASINNGTTPLTNTHKMRRVHHAARHLHHGVHSF
ncbi:hypothetical protein OE88DRAFT_1736630 [Heliocybe sulcata]|uniref:Plastocyanin-like domain-containing protein n=1 Tax=Heliocybe sulcata TaxID=5364 RepID=A0A5C3MZI8_9AGAM|nr:hypothetical protein OE88DRAFT_1736630 [Heliocybe sulcata]